MARQRLVIVGGVAGGATAAARARRLSEDAEIVVFERGPHVSFANCGLAYHIGGEIEDRDDLLLQTPESLRKRYNLNVRVRSEVLAIDRDTRTIRVRDLTHNRTYTERYDKLILATGAAPLRPPLAGIDHPRIFSLRNLNDMDRIKAVVDNAAERAVVVGGGFIGLEVAENLRRRGVQVHLIERLDQVMAPLDPEMAAPIREELARNDVDVRLGESVASFDEDGRNVVTVLESGERIAADFVILALGVRPESKLAREAGLAISSRGGVKVDRRMRTSDPNIYAVGDAVEVREFVLGGDTIVPLAGPANRQGRIAADNIFGHDSAYRGTQGTSIVRVFDLVVGTTGVNEKALRDAHVEYEKVYIHPDQHAAYFPEPARMTIKLLFATAGGRVLGAQVVGGDGVDKRIDVLAMAIQAGMTVYDLEEVELAYAPQFGSAKDPVNMAGFVAAGVLRGDVRVAHADSLAESMLVDVRSREEHADGAIPGSVSIPLDELRARHHELPPYGHFVVYCQVGLRGYVAARLLTQLGYDVRNLSGGYQTYQSYVAAGLVNDREREVLTTHAPLSVGGP